MAFELRNKEYNIVLSTDLQVITLELPKFTVPLQHIKSPLEQWMHFLRYGQTMDSDNVPAELNTPEICKALEELNVLSHDDLERERYLARVRVLRDEKTLLLFAAESHAKGIEEGLEEGIDKGKVQIICRQLRCKLGSIDGNLQTQIEKLDADQLDALSEALLTFSTVEDLGDWLRKRASANA